MGLVYMAYDPVLDRRVAIKQMTAEIADNEELRQRFYVEARAAARLNHPNIITIHELQEASGEIFMIMELLEGKSLAALVQAKPVPLSLEATLDVMAQVCDGLDYAHQKTIVHRDIKPGNLFLTPSGTVKILDFGIARLGSLHMTATGALIGTPDYMAPEQIRGDEIDRRTDLWAVGAVIYQLLSGTKPFEGRAAGQAALGHRPVAARAAAGSRSGRTQERLGPRGPPVVEAARWPAGDGGDRPRRTASDHGPRVVGRHKGDARPRGLRRDGVLGDAQFSAAGARNVCARSGVGRSAVAASASTAGGQNRAAGRPGALVADGRAGVRRDPAAKRTDGGDRSGGGGAGSAGPGGAAGGGQAAAATRGGGPCAEEPGVAAADRNRRRRGGGALRPHGSWRRSVVVLHAARSERRRALRHGRDDDVRARLDASLGDDASHGDDASGAVKGRGGLTRRAGGRNAGSRRAARGADPAGYAPRRRRRADAWTSADSAGRAGGCSGAAPAQPPAQPPAATIAPPTLPGGDVAAKPAAAPPAAIRPPGAPVESGVAAPNAARPGVNQSTVDSLAGRQAGEGYDAGTATSAQAAVSRISYVLEQYVKALVNADAEAIREFRPSLSPGESALMRARQLKLRLEDVRIEVNGAEATARCRRRIDGTSESGAPLQEDGVAIYRLVRKASGWVIADVR